MVKCCNADDCGKQQGRARIEAGEVQKKMRRRKGKQKAGNTGSDLLLLLKMEENKGKGKRRFALELPPCRGNLSSFSPIVARHIEPSLNFLFFLTKQTVKGKLSLSVLVSTSDFFLR